MKTSLFFKKWLLLLLSLLLLIAPLAACSEKPSGIDPLYGAYYYVSPDGDDANPGTEAKPFQTIARARDAIRENGVPSGGVLVSLREGTYFQEEALRFDAQDTGTAENPVVYAAYRNETVVLTGAAVLRADGFVKASEMTEGAAARIQADALPFVWVYDLSADGIDPGSIPQHIPGQPGDPTPPALSVDGKTATLARYPNADAETPFLYGNCVEGGFIPRDYYDDHFYSGNFNVGEYIPPAEWMHQQAPIYTYSDARIDRWADEPEVFFNGYFYYDWYAANLRIREIDPVAKRIYAAYPPTYGAREEGFYYAFNLLCELDCEGEYYIDREAGLLYVYSEAAMQERQVQISTNPGSVLTVDGASHLYFKNLTFDQSTETMLSLTDCTAVSILQCTFTNAGTYAVAVGSGCTQCVVRECTITASGSGGVSLAGGDFETLTPGENRVESCHIYDTGRVSRTYSPAVSVSGVGQIVRNNVIHDLPHSAVMFSGNDHLIELNEFYNVLYETGDAGVIYSGRDWTHRGNVICYNYFHDIPNPSSWTAAIYLDDAMSSAEIYGNVFYNIADIANLLGGGRDHFVHDNLYVNVGRVFSFDARTLETWFAHALPTMRSNLEAVPYTNTYWTAKYPKLAETYGHLDIEDPAALAQAVEKDALNLIYPAGNVIRDEVQINSYRGSIDSLVRVMGDITYPERISLNAEVVADTWISVNDLLRSANVDLELRELTISMFIQLMRETAAQKTAE